MSRLIWAAAAALSLALAGCGEPGAREAGTPGEDPAAVAESDATLKEDCAGVPFRNPEVLATGLSNWNLRYGARCPDIVLASQNCTRMRASEEEKSACLRQNVEASNLLRPRFASDSAEVVLFARTLIES